MFRGVCTYLFAIVAILHTFVLDAAAQSVANAIPRRLTLNQAETLLIERNFTVLAARYQVEASRAARLIAGYKLNPTLTLGAEQLPFSSTQPINFERFLKTNPDAGAIPVYTVRIDQIIERGNKRELRTSAADEQLKSSEAQMLDAIRTQMYQLRRAFTAAILARENLRLAEETERQYTQTQTLTQAKVDQGDIARLELYRAGAGRLQYQQAVLQARTTYDTAIRDVLNVLGTRQEEVSTSIAENASLDPSPPVSSQMPESIRNALLEVVADFDSRPVAQSLNELRAIALENRPDVVAARHLVASAQLNTQLALAQRMRDVDIGYEYQRVGSDHSVGFTVQVPLLIRNNQRTLYTQADAQKRAIEAQLKQTETQALTDVEKAYQSYLSARQVLDLYTTENLDQLERLRTIATVSYKQGASSLFELLDAQRSYNVAMTTYNQARSDYQMALWDLEQATGVPLR
jgi:cobalt-zinc-cadmium efflux system outer membrane protein